MTIARNFKRKRNNDINTHAALPIVRGERYMPATPTIPGDCMPGDGSATLVFIDGARARLLVSMIYQGWLWPIVFPYSEGNNVLRKLEGATHTNNY